MIKALTIRNLLGIHAIELTIGPGGALIEGGNGRGKTTVLKALKAALDGSGISPEAVRKGESAAEILIDLDDDTVRRRITAAGATSLTVEDAAGSRRKKPQAFLSELLGLALLDPLDLFLAKPGERRAMVLRAVPCTVTPEMLRPHLPSGFEVTAADCTGHGLDVVDLIRSNVAIERTETGRDMKARETEAIAAAKKATEAQATAERLATAPTKEAAAERLQAATNARADVAARGHAAAKMTTFVDGQRAKAKKLQLQAGEVRLAAPLAPTAEQTEEAADLVRLAHENEKNATDLLRRADEEVARVEQLLVEAQEERSKRAGAVREAERLSLDASAVVEMLARRDADAHEHADKALRLDADAEDELAALTGLGATPPTDEERAAAEAEHVAATQAVRDADEAEKAQNDYLAARAAALAATERRDALVDRYNDLDASVKALASDVPRQLLAGAAGLSGLTIDGDTILVDDGKGAQVDIERLSTGAQMGFALTIAKRLNERSKLLLVDGLERLDGEHRGDFVRLAIEGGYQLFATRVTEGPLSVSPIGGVS